MSLVFRLFCDFFVEIAQTSMVQTLQLELFVEHFTAALPCSSENEGDRTGEQKELCWTTSRVGILWTNIRASLI